jgi:thymidylate synthase
MKVYKTYYTANEVWASLLDDILTYGENVSPRGMLCKEIRCNKTVIDMHYPIVTNPVRKLGYKFMAAEAYWIITGDNRVKTIAPYSKDISNYSDDGVIFAGAYGPEVIKQISYVLKQLRKDRDTRQAVMTIWKKSPAPSKDIPCTISVQWLIRNNVLHCIDTMRSSDAWMGWVYDVFNFTMLSAYLALALEDVELGSLTLVAGSQHLYEKHFELARSALYATPEKIKPFTLKNFSDPWKLIKWLKDCREIGIYKAMKEG